MKPPLEGDDDRPRLKAERSVESQHTRVDRVVVRVDARDAMFDRIARHHQLQHSGYSPTAMALEHAGDADLGIAVSTEQDRADPHHGSTLERHEDGFPPRPWSRKPVAQEGVDRRI